MIPAQLSTELEELKGDGHTLEVTEDAHAIYIVLRRYPLPVGYNKASTDLLVKVPISYPNGRPDMFWTDADLTLEDGQVPKSADAIEELEARRWRRFSWHPQGWNPGTDNIRTYLEFVNSRLAKKV